MAASSPNEQSKRVQCDSCEPKDELAWEISSGQRQNTSGCAEHSPLYLPIVRAGLQAKFATPITAIHSGIQEEYREDENDKLQCHLLGGHDTVNAANDDLGFGPGESDSTSTGSDDDDNDETRIFKFGKANEDLIFPEEGHAHAQVMYDNLNNFGDPGWSDYIMEPYATGYAWDALKGTIDIDSSYLAPLEEEHPLEQDFIAPEDDAVAGAPDAAIFGEQLRDPEYTQAHHPSQESFPTDHFDKLPHNRSND